jgi:RES domain-containing protein
VAPLEVTAERIADLRDTSAMAALGVDPAEAALDWQQALAHGEIPASWRVRDLLQHAGAAGLIDPSRKRPGLWHLTLFAWNQEGAPSVRWLVEPGSP